MDALELCNKINMEAESLADSGFPLEVFPQKMQSIIIDMVVHGNFKVDYVAMSMPVGSICGSWQYLSYSR